MERYIQQARTKMGNAETTTDERYERQRVFLKQYVEIGRNVNNALSKAMKAMNEFVLSLEGVQKAYEQVLTLGNYHDTLSNVNNEFGKTFSEWKELQFPKFERLMQQEVLPGFPSLMEEHARVEALRQDRRKLVDTYDYFRNEVLEKEKEYQKKGKPLTESQTYQANVMKMEDARKQFEEVAKRFDQDATNFMLRKDVVTAHTLQCGLEHWSGILGVLYSHLDRVFRFTAVHTHYVEGYPPIAALLRGSPRSR
jgi:hypothetical protein